MCIRDRVYPLAIDTAISHFETLDESELTLLEATHGDASDMKELLKAKWKEVKDAT